MVWKLQQCYVTKHTTVFTFFELLILTLENGSKITTQKKKKKKETTFKKKRHV